MRKGMTKLTGRAPASGRSGIEPIEVWAHQPKLLSGMGKFQQAVRKAHAVDERLKNLVEVTDELVNPLDFSGSGAAHRARQLRSSGVQLTRALVTHQPQEQRRERRGPRFKRQRGLAAEHDGLEFECNPRD
jgi:hypothetical protein